MMHCDSATILIYICFNICLVKCIYIYIYIYIRLTVRSLTPRYLLYTVYFHILTTVCALPIPAGGAGGKTGIEKMMESMESGDAGGLPMVRPGDASK